MADYLVTDTELTGVADAIRTKTGGSATLAFPTGFTDAIGGIVTLAGGTADATATRADIKNGKTAYVAGTKVTGNYVPSATISAGSQKSVTKNIAKATYSAGSALATITRPANEIWDDDTTFVGSRFVLQGGSPSWASELAISMSGYDSLYVFTNSSINVTSNSYSIKITYTPQYEATAT